MSCFVWYKLVNCSNVYLYVKYRTIRVTMSKYMSPLVDQEIYNTLTRHLATKKTNNKFCIFVLFYFVLCSTVLLFLSLFLCYIVRPSRSYPVTLFRMDSLQRSYNCSFLVFTPLNIFSPQISGLSGWSCWNFLFKYKINYFDNGRST
jgi:hypothetical protein